MSDLSEFTIASPRPLPVIILADISGSMSQNGKIDSLNSAIAEMLSSFSQEEDYQAEIHVCVITFGKLGAAVSIPLQPASQIKWQNFEADGYTPMAAAFNVLADLIEDKEKIPSRAYRPMLILVSDGQPTDDFGKPSNNWKDPLKRVLAGRAAKSYRFAMGIGADADHNVLREFVANPEMEVFSASNARDIRKFFRWVTMSVYSRTRSVSPNSFVKIDISDLDQREV